MVMYVETWWICYMLISILNDMGYGHDDSYENDCDVFVLMRL